MAKTRKQIPVIQTQYAKIFVELFTQNGYDIHKILQDSDLPADLMKNNSDYVPAESIKRLIYMASSQLGVTKFSELLCLSFRRNIIPNLLVGLENYTTFGDLLQDFEVLIRQDSPGSTATYAQLYGQHWIIRPIMGNQEWYTQLNELFMVLYVQELVTLLTGEEWFAKTVHLQGKEFDIVKDLLNKNCQISIEQPYTGVLIPQEIYDHKISIGSTTRTAMEWHTSFTDSVFETLRPYCLEQNLTVEEAAGILNYSVRTFQRKLSEEHTSFRKLKDSILLSLSCELMEQGKTLTFIAKQLGYQDISHFSRAFKRITGLTPKLYKKSLAPEKG